MLEATSREIPATGGALSAYNQPEANTSAASMPPALRKPRLRRWEASEYLGLVHGLTVATATLAKLASIGGGPSFQKNGRFPLYPTAELDRWANERLGRLIRSTSEAEG
ncbi:hypothetical protein [Azospirillum argentinense]|uniref:hypothetical protein n=1 Tax=Azospirillum argentinense TaxID=2970906 RepID=UPI0032DFAA42